MLRRSRGLTTVALDDRAPGRCVLTARPHVLRRRGDLTTVPHVLPSRASTTVALDLLAPVGADLHRDRLDMLAPGRGRISTAVASTCWRPSGHLDHGGLDVLARVEGGSRPRWPRRAGAGLDHGRPDVLAPVGARSSTAVALDMLAPGSRRGPRSRSPRRPSAGRRGPRPRSPRPAGAGRRGPRRRSPRPAGAGEGAVLDRGRLDVPAPVEGGSRPRWPHQLAPVGAAFDRGPRRPGPGRGRSSTAVASTSWPRSSADLDRGRLDQLAPVERGSRRRSPRPAGPGRGRISTAVASTCWRRSSGGLDHGRLDQLAPVGRGLDHGRPDQLAPVGGGSRRRSPRRAGAVPSTMVAPRRPGARSMAVALDMLAPVGAGLDHGGPRRPGARSRADLDHGGLDVLAAPVGAVFDGGRLDMLAPVGAGLDHGRPRHAGARSRADLDHGRLDDPGAGRARASTMVALDVLAAGRWRTSPRRPDVLRRRRGLTCGPRHAGASRRGPRPTVAPTSWRRSRRGPRRRSPSTC